VKEVMNGYKVCLLLHILAYCEQIDDKVLIFANNIPTLNYIEEVLALPDWTQEVPSLAAKFPGMKLGGWKNSIDYLRIDGTTSGAERGKLVNDFKETDGVKAFLLSQAGGIGINLVRRLSQRILCHAHFAAPTTLIARHFNLSLDYRK